MLTSKCNTDVAVFVLFLFPLSLESLSLFYMSFQMRTLLIFFKVFNSHSTYMLVISADFPPPLQRPCFTWGLTSLNWIIQPFEKSDFYEIENELENLGSALVLGKKLKTRGWLVIFCLNCSQNHCGKSLGSTDLIYLYLLNWSNFIQFESEYLPLFEVWQKILIYFGSCFYQRKRIYL